MTQHIEVNGRPWCQCGANHLFPHAADPLQAHRSLLEKSYTEAVYLACQASSNPDTVVKFLNDNGIPAALVDGPCPTLLEYQDPADPLNTP